VVLILYKQQSCELKNDDFSRTLIFNEG